MHILHETAGDVVESFMLALGGVSDRNAEYVLYFADAYIDAYEAELFKEVDANEVQGLKTDGLVPDDLLPREDKPLAPPPAGLPDAMFFFGLFEWIDERIFGPEKWLGKFFGPVGRQPRIMRLYHDVRSEFHIAAAQLTGRARAIERATRQQELGSPAEISPRTSAAALLASSSTTRPNLCGYQRLSLETIHLIMSYCASLRDVQNLLYSTRWGHSAAETAPCLNLMYPDGEDAPTEFAEAWWTFALLPKLLRFSTNAPLRNSLVPRMPPWTMPCALVDMSVRERWAGPGFKFWRTLGALGEEIIDDFTVVNPTAEVVRHFCQKLRDPAIRLSFVRHEDANKVVGYDVVLELESGRVRRLCDLDAELDALVFDPITFRAVSQLVVPDALRPSALKAIYDMEFTLVAQLEVVLDAESDRTLPLRPESTRLLQQYRDWTRPKLRFPSVTKLILSSQTPMDISLPTVISFRASVNHNIQVDTRNVLLV